MKDTIKVKPDTFCKSCNDEIGICGFCENAFEEKDKIIHISSYIDFDDESNLHFCSKKCAHNWWGHLFDSTEVVSDE